MATSMEIASVGHLCRREFIRALHVNSRQPSSTSNPQRRLSSQQLGACLPAAARDLVERSFDLDLIHTGPSSSGTTPGAIPMRLEQSAGNLDVGTTRTPFQTRPNEDGPPCSPNPLE